MKPAFPTALIATVMALAWSSLPSMAQTSEVTGTAITNLGTFNNVVLNSTYTFSGLNPYGTDNFVATLDQTTIPDLPDLNPPVQFQLAITSFTLTDTGDDFTGTGIPTITLSFQVQPNTQQGGTFPEMTVTLKGNQSINGSYQASATHPLVFSLDSVTPPTVSVTEMNPENAGNQDNEGTATFTETVSNFEPKSNVTLNNGFTVDGGQTTLNYQSQNQVYSVGGNLEVIYAVPEPTAWLMGLVASGIFLVLYRRQNLRD